MIEYEGTQYDEDQPLRVTVAAQIARKHRRTVVNWCKKGLIPSRKMPGERGHYEIKAGDLIAALTKPGYDPLQGTDV